jgi:hypothetical protein
MKKCFKTKRSLPLFMFDKAQGYSREAEQGRVIVCRICTIKQNLAWGGVFYKGDGWKKEHPLVEMPWYKIILFNLLGHKGKMKMLN